MASELEKRRFETPLGEVWLWARPDAYEAASPAVLVICGAFQAERNAFWQLADLLREASVFIGHLPGNHCPELAEVSVEAYARAYDAALATFIGSRALVVCGVSVGSFVALAMSSPAIRRRVLLDPPLVTNKLWLLRRVYAEKVAAGPESWEARFVRDVIGFKGGADDGRDYRPLLDGLDTPTLAILGDVPLYPERQITTIPSLVDEPERRLLEHHPAVKVLTIPGTGHTLDMPVIVRCLARLAAGAATSAR